MSGDRRKLLAQLVLHLVLAIAAVGMLFPFYVLLRTAFTEEKYIVDGSLGLSHLTLENFRQVWAEVDWVSYYGTSITVTVLIFGFQVATSLPVGYALARLTFRGRRPAMWLVLVCLIIPPQVTAIPNYVILSRAGASDSIAGLILPSCASAFGIYLFRQFCLTIPQSLFDAARIDRVGPVSMVWHIVLPSVRPALLALGVFSVIGSWNDLFWPSVILRTDTYATVPYGIARFAAGEEGGMFGNQMAAATLAVIPLVIVFVFTQKQFVRGLALHNDAS